MLVVLYILSKFKGFIIVTLSLLFNTSLIFFQCHWFHKAYVQVSYVAQSIGHIFNRGSDT